MKKVTILVEVISTLGAFASILWLFLDPGPDAFAASIVALAAILAIGVQAQVKLGKVSDESLLARIHSIQEIRRVTDDVPRLPINEFYKKLKTDNEFTNMFTARSLRIFGLRRELIPVLEPELINLIDNKLEPLFDIAIGRYNLKKGKLKQFAIISMELAELVRTIESKLTKQYMNRFDLK